MKLSQLCKPLAYLLFLPVLLPPVAHADTGKPLMICIDTDGLDSESKDPHPEKLFTGPIISIVTEVFRQAGKDIKLVNDGPWNRCLHDVELGYMDFAMGAYYDEKRARVFDYSDHYNTLTPSIFFLASKQFKIEKPEDLKKLRGCGINGYSYAHYNIRPEELDLTTNYGSLYRKLIADRCDYFLDELESFISSSNEIDFFHNPLIRHVPVAWANPPASYVITKKSGPNSNNLKDFNQSLKVVIKSGIAARIWNDSISDIPYRP